MGIFGLLSIFLLFVIAYFYLTSHAFKYWFKLFWFYSIGLTTGFWVIPYCLRRPRDVTNLSAVAAFWNVTLRIFGVDVYVRDRKNLVSEKASVIMLNHQSSLDLIPMMRALPERSSALAKKELLYTGVFGLASWLCGLVFIDRNNKEKARKTMIAAVDRVKNERIKLWVFPEGTRHMGETFLPFKKGGFHLAIQAQIPIMPIVVTSYKHFYSDKRKIFNGGKVLVTCLPPVSTEGLTTEDANDLTERVRQMMWDTYLKTTAEVEMEAERNGTSILPPKSLKNIDEAQKGDSNVETVRAEGMVTEKIEDIVKVPEKDEDIVKVTEKDEDIVKVPEKDEDIVKVTEKDEDIVKVTEKEGDIVKVTEKEGDIMNKPSFQDDDEEPETLSLAEDDKV